MTIDYDPFSDAAMRDPFPLYAAMRAEGGPQYIAKYNAWALARFEDVWEASMHHEADVTWTAGATPAQLLLGDPIPRAFTTMDAPEHRKWRGVIRREYTPEAVRLHEQRLRTLAREVLDPLLARGEFDAYADYANRVFCLNSGFNLGLPREDALTWRALIDELMHRDPGQCGGSSSRNQYAATQLAAYMHDYVQRLRVDPGLASGHTAAYLNAEIDGERLDDEGMVNILMNFLIVGSETTPMVCAGALHYLEQHPAQKAAVLADHALIPRLFFETCRYDQPTNMLCRRAKRDFTLGGAQIRAGQNLLYIYASANRDEREFVNAAQFDIFRNHERDLTYGAGGHKCLGMHLATMGAVIVLEELLASIRDFEVRLDGCRRAYGEHLSGFERVPVRVHLG
ncbi:MAG: cytochrome P450 [Pseudomonadales bacterium]